MKKGQAAMEFIMTYGWAMLALLVAIGAISYFGVLNPAKMLPEKCIVTPGFSCVDAYLSKYDPAITQCEVSFALKNNLGEPIVILQGSTNITCVDNCDYNSDDNLRYNCFHYRLEDDTLLRNQEFDIPVGTDERFVLECNSGEKYYIDFPSDGQRAKIKFSFLYKAARGTFSHLAEGEIISEVQEQKCGVNKCMYPAEMTC